MHYIETIARGLNVCVIQNVPAQVCKTNQPVGCDERSPELFVIHICFE